MMQSLSQHQIQQFFEQGFINNSLVMLSINSETYAILQANKQAIEFYGHSYSELTTMSFTDLCVTADADYNTQIHSVINGTSNHMSVTQRTATGHLSSMQVHITPLEIDNQPPQLLLTLIDITQHQQATKHHEDMTTRYRIIANFNHDWEYWITPDGLIGYMSPSCERITGYTAEEFINNPQLLSDIVHPRDKDDWEYYLKHLSDDTQKPRTSIQFRIHHRNGETLWIEHVNQIIIDENDIYLGHRASNRDITQRQSIELKLQRNKEILELAVESAGMAIWEWDIANNTTIYNPRWAELLGYSYDEIQPMNTIWERLVHPQDKANSIIEMNKLIEGEIAVLEIEQRMQSHSGEWRWFMSRGTVTERSELGEPLRFVGLDIDITDRKQTESDAFKFALERQRIDVLSTFMQNAKHEFKTPLSRINTKLYLIRKTEDKERLKQLTQEIEAQVTGIDNLVESMMLMSRLDTVHRIPDTPVDLRTILTTLPEEFNPLITERQLHLISNIPSHIPKFRGNTNDLYEAFYRVFDNAVRYTDENGHITISTTIGQGNIIVEIKDTGAGISDDALPHIFERFFREDKAHTTSGIGLGLPIAQRIINHHRGNIRVASKLDFGTTVQIIIPIRAQ